MTEPLEKPRECPAEKYLELDEEVRDWLERATPEKLKRLDYIILSFERLAWLGGLGRWVIFGVLSMIVLFSGALEAAGKILKWLKGVP